MKNISILPCLLSLMFGAGCIERDLSDSFHFETDIQHIDVDLDAANLLILPMDDDTVSVEMDIEYWGDEPDYDVWVENGTLKIEIDCDWSCDGRFVARVPTAASARIDTGSGDVKIHDLEGDLRVDVGSGDVTVEDTLGFVELFSGSGDIKGTRLYSESCVAETGSGDIDISFDGTPRRVDLDTGSGDVDLDVPAGSYDISISTGSGDKSIRGLDDDTSADNQIRVETGSGDVTIRGT